jgi:chitin-binding protein
LRKRRRFALATALATLPALAATLLVAANPVSAHGAAMVPGSRTFLCWQDGLTPQGNIVPNNPACAAAIAQSGTNSMYNWFAVLRSDSGGRVHDAALNGNYIPNGRLCSGAASVYDFEGFNLARNDWPLTHLTSGATIQFRFNKWAAHPGSFRSYITKDSWSPTRPLAWTDLEPTPFDTVVDPPSVGSPGNVEAWYHWNAQLPSGKSGRHLIYTVWTRSDSAETFYNCSDVVFDGGNGEVTGIGPGSGGPGDPGNPGTCTASLQATSTWNGGLQGQGTVTNTGTSTLFGWTTSFTMPSGLSIASVWNGTYTPSGSLSTVRGVDHNRTLAPGASASFGFVANGSGTLPSATCSSP